MLLNILEHSGIIKQSGVIKHTASYRPTKIKEKDITIYLLDAMNVLTWYFKKTFIVIDIVHFQSGNQCEIFQFKKLFYKS